MTPFVVLMRVMLAASAFLLKGAPAPSGKAGKLDSLEGVRGAAAFMVVFFHFMMVFYPAMITGQPGEMHHPAELLFAITPLFALYSGIFFVALFFVLSGFVLSDRFLLEKRCEIVFSSACRRYLRLAYPVLLTTAFYCVLMLGGLLSLAQCNQLALVTHSKHIINLFDYTPDLGGMLHGVLFRLFLSFLLIAGASWLRTLVSHAATLLQKLFASPLGKFMGNLSFSLYLIHYSVLFTLGFNLFWCWQSLYGYHLAILLSLALCLPVMIALFYLVYLTVDRASHQLGKLFYKVVVQKPLAIINWTVLLSRSPSFFIPLRPA